MLGWLLGGLWLVGLRAWLLGHPGLNADALTIADVWRSLSTGGHLGDWTMSQHTYLFPDLPLYAVATRFAPDLAGRQLAYGLLTGALLWWILAHLLQRLEDVRPNAARAYAAAGLLLMLPCLNEANGLGQVFYPAFHSGALVVALAWLSWTLAQDRVLSSWSGVAWAGCWGGLTWASDQITPLWALAPALFLSLGLSGQARRRVWAGVGLSAGLRWGMLALWRWQGMQVAHYRLDYFLQHRQGMLAAAMAQSGPALRDSAGALLLGLAALALLWSRRWQRPLAPWWAGMVLLVAAGTLALSGLQGALQGRYLALACFASAPLVVMLLARRWPDQPLVLAAALLSALLWLAYFPPPAAAAADGPQAQAQWLDAQLEPRGLDRGWADYWHARPLRLFSGRTTLAPVLAEGAMLLPYQWSVDRRVFAVSQPQFVVVNGLDPGAVRAGLGKPREMMSGAGLEVWIYAPAAGPQRL